VLLLDKPSTTSTATRSARSRFLDRIATHVLAFEGDGVVRWFEGNFTEYEEYRYRELGVAVDQPHRIRLQQAGGVAAFDDESNADSMPV
jgi:hypothetical protein